ncbi:glycoside hydrolase family 15 protein [Paenibacillus sp. GCM10023252]|uniref:glycoside hydrolase family 15 protein n=1 Tax=Paenibacillus sp. GCM10023252 TaxID=3252649 RepID=UPI00361284A8
MNSKSIVNANTAKPYLVDGIIGNSKFLASLGRTGRMYRLWWPNIDFPQHMDEMLTGLKLDGQASVSWFDGEEDGWQHEVAYEKRTNILGVKASSAQCPVAVDSRHYAVPGQSILVREYDFKNTGSSAVSFEFIVYSSFLITENPYYNTTTFNVDQDALVHFRHKYFFALSSANVCTKFQSGQSWAAAQTGELNGAVIDMKPDGALVYRVEGLEPGSTVSIPLYITAGHDEQSVLLEMAVAKQRTAADWHGETAAYWHQYLAAATPCPLEGEEIAELYDRSLLMFKLMSDEATGTIVAAPEFDEHYEKCGGYSYCWGRDAAFITTALNKAGLSELSDRFYDWTLTAQSPDGSWQQRHYHDGSLAPSWGLQIDEGASIIWGMWEHYYERNDRAFAERVWPAVERGAVYLAAYLDEETGLPLPSNDLWEEREAEHTYSAAAVYGGMTAAAAFARLMGREDLAAEWSAIADRIAKSLLEKGWNEEGDSFYRALKLTVNQEKYEAAIAAGKSGSAVPGLKGYTKYVLEHDPIVDISLLGIAVPFGAVPADHDYMKRTADTVERLLTVPGVGGILRYEDDIYAGGNPWILTTMWLAHYRIQTGDIAAAEKHLEWVLKHRTETGLLPEQIDKVTGETAWVVPLTWSHAMYVLCVFMLAAAKK